MHRFPPSRKPHTRLKPTKSLILAPISTPTPSDLLSLASSFHLKDSAAPARLPIATIPANLGAKLVYPKHRNEVKAVEGYHLSRPNDHNISVISLNSSLDYGSVVTQSSKRLSSLRRSQDSSAYNPPEIRTYRSKIFLTGNPEGVSRLQSKTRLSRGRLAGSESPDRKLRQGGDPNAVVSYSGDYYKSVKQGEGEAMYGNQDTYRGNWTDGERNGYGEFVYCGVGVGYKGDWKDGLKHGTGVLQFANGDTMECIWSKDAIADKTASIVYEKLEARYDGEILHCAKHGHGELHFPPHSFYRGFWHSDKRHGAGLLSTPDFIYEGMFDHDISLGPGVLLIKSALLTRAEMTGNVAILVEEKAKLIGDLTDFYHFAYSARVGGTDVVWKSATLAEVKGRIGEVDGGVDGNFVNGVLNGCGVCLYGNFGLYIGTFKEGKRSGFGQMSYHNSSGVCVNFPDLSGVYTGKWRNDERHGYGKMTWSDGTVYEGYFVRDHRDGVEGVMVRSNGERFEGRWKGNMMNGLGKYTDSKGYVYKGEFVGGHPGREGELSFPDGSAYRGEVADMQANGTGKLTYPNGDVYSGEFQSGLRHGKGTMSYANGSVYKGDWRKGLRHGSGQMQTQNQTFDGLWRHDRPHGPGLLTCDCETLSGTWVEGEAEGHMLVINPHS